MYESNFFKHLGKLRTQWLGSYIVMNITDGGAMKLQKLDGTEVQDLVNGSRLKLYHNSCDFVA